MSKRCAANGNHTTEEHASECPLLDRTKQARVDKWRAQQRTR